MANIEKVVIWNRTDGGLRALPAFDIEVSETDPASVTDAEWDETKTVFSSTHTPWSKQTQAIIPAKTKGRYVRMRLKANYYLYLAEMEVFGLPDRDITPPVVTAPADRVFEAAGLLTSVDLGLATAIDEVDGALIPSANPSGPFALGEHVITWTAVDAQGNTGQGTQTISIKDTTPPDLSIPADRHLVSEDGTPVVVDIGNPTVFDLFDVVVSNDAPAVYPLGMTPVIWVATDANG